MRALTRGIVWLAITTAIVFMIAAVLIATR